LLWCYSDADTRTVYHHLITAAAVPYFDMVHQWIHHGVIVDPYDEFAVKSKEVCTDSESTYPIDLLFMRFWSLKQDLNKDNIRKDALDTYWTSRYSARNEKAPAFLEPLMERIVKTGKYLNVIRECGLLVASSPEKTNTKLMFTTDHRLYATVVDHAYGFASRELLNLLMGEKQLMARLRSIKRYFLLDQGDFFVHFMDIAEPQLKQARSDIVKEKLDSLLELALRTSKASSDPFKDDLVCTLSGVTLVQKL
jgi:gamma-tubulin complex component 2